MYMALKHLHMTFAGLSIGLFVLRGIWMFADSPRLNAKLTRIVPHVVDTVLLASAVGLMFVIHQYPFAQGWLTAKLLGLVLYIVLGTIALKRGSTKTIRGIAFFAAVAVFVWIFMTATMRMPWLLPV
ncbi:MAG: SirB2 family protein [Gammaproteobacteria bacterium]|jgi:uncharacterized membrane protein SirB2